MGRPVKKSVLHDIIMDVNLDGTNVDTVGGNPDDNYNNSLLDGQPDFLDYVEGRGNLTTLDTNFGWNATGMWFSGDAGSDTPCYPIYTTFTIPESSKTVVSWQFTYTASADLTVCVYLDGDVPDFSWDANTTRIAAQYDSEVPEIAGLLTDSVGTSVLQVGETYYAEFTYDPLQSLVQFKTFDAELRLVSALELTEKLDPGSYLVGFAADQDDGIPPATKSYFQNLDITITPGELQQIATTSYNVDAYHGSGRVRLVADDTPAQFDGNVVATDYNGSTYWVTKLSAHLVTLERRTMVGSYEYNDGDTAPWSFEAATALGVVQVNNA
jgi:hypothetical protein